MAPTQTPEDLKAGVRADTCTRIIHKSPKGINNPSVRHIDPFSSEGHSHCKRAEAFSLFINIVLGLPKTEATQVSTVDGWMGGWWIDGRMGGWVDG